MEYTMDEMLAITHDILNKAASGMVDEDEMELQTYIASDPLIMSSFDVGCLTGVFYTLRYHKNIHE